MVFLNHCRNPRWILIHSLICPFEWMSIALIKSSDRIIEGIMTTIAECREIRTGICLLVGKELPKFWYKDVRNPKLFVTSYYRDFCRYIEFDSHVFCDFYCFRRGIGCFLVKNHYGFNPNRLSNSLGTIFMNLKTLQNHFDGEWIPWQSNCIYCHYLLICVS